MFPSPKMSYKESAQRAGMGELGPILVSSVHAILKPEKKRKSGEW
jgi:hypothetical protein